MKYKFAIAFVITLLFVTGCGNAKPSQPSTVIELYSSIGVEVDEDTVTGNLIYHIFQHGVSVVTPQQLSAAQLRNLRQHGYQDVR